MATSQHLLPRLLSWPRVLAKPHCPAQGCSVLQEAGMGRGQGRWFAHRAHLSGDAPGSLGNVPWVGWLPLSSHLSALEGRKTALAQGGTLVGFVKECHLLQAVIDGGMCLVSISATTVPRKPSLYVKIHYKQKVKREKSSSPHTQQRELT